MTRVPGCGIFHRRHQHHSIGPAATNCGADGVWLRTAPGCWQHQPAPPVAEVHDATGAGDAFWAGFLTGWLSQQGVPDCVRAGQALAARYSPGSVAAQWRALIEQVA